MTGCGLRKVWMPLAIALCALIASATGTLAQAPTATQIATTAQSATGNGASGGAGGRHNEWTWVSGAGESAAARKGIYGTLGVAGAGNVPGGRMDSVCWTDAAGNVWLFGGYGFDSAGTEGWLGDLWKYGGGEWTWISGSKLAGQAGIYGTLGVAAAGNAPGARASAAGWTDAAGNFWMFGGFGFDSAGLNSDLNDLWKYSEGEWTWMGGSNVAQQPGVYGTKGTAALGNIPGSRDGTLVWTDAAGNVWIYGGNGFGWDGFESTPRMGYYMDLWKYSAGQWTWMGGPNVIDQDGGNESLVTAAMGNLPWPHGGDAAWEDASGNFWLFRVGSAGGEMWKYSAGQWTLVRQWAVSANRGTYGVQGKAAPGNVPGPRGGVVTWTDAAGNFWLFGGDGHDVVGGIGHLNDMWEYSAGEWTWVGGSKVEGEVGTRGTRGVAAAGNVPGARENAVGWTDAQGNFWLFGGSGYNDATPHGFNDLWKYVP
jgi:hypothetical protein